MIESDGSLQDRVRGIAESLGGFGERMAMVEIGIRTERAVL